MSERRLRFDGKTEVCSGNKGEAKGEVGGEEKERGKKIIIPSRTYPHPYTSRPPH